ncbi:MAG: class I SAM-dependent methyltransferase [Planctomycetes bacterium]|nr:class I SAM-dependent methyltransferase [Planctomycetota bacterium]
MDGGTWDQILKVQPDLSGLLGSVPIEKIELDGEAVRFKTTVTFGERTIDLGFEGELKEGKLTGQLSTPQGTRSVEGRKAGRGGQAPAKRVRIKKPDVIFVPTPEVVVEKMLELAKVGKDDLVYDLGCGDGRIVVTAAKKYGCRGVGFDVDPDRIEESLKNVKEKGVEDLVKIEQKDIFTLDLSDASVITLYLLPSLNVKLIPQLEKLKPGSRIVSHDFDMKGVKPDLVVEVRSENQYGEHTVYLWTTPLKKEAASDE